MTFLTNLKAKVLGSVDDIVAEFHNTANKLDVRAKLHAEAAKAHEEAASLATKAREVEQAAADRASNIAARIKQLVS